MVAPPHPINPPRPTARQSRLSISIPPSAHPSSPPAARISSEQVHSCTCAREQSSDDNASSLAPLESVEYDEPPPYTGYAFPALPPSHFHAPYYSSTPLGTDSYHDHDYNRTYAPAFQSFDHQYPYPDPCSHCPMNLNQYSRNPFYSQPSYHQSQMPPSMEPSYYQNEAQQHQCHNPPYPFDAAAEAQQQQRLRDYHASLPPMYPYDHQTRYHPDLQGVQEWPYDQMISNPPGPSPSPSYSPYYSESMNTSNSSFRSALTAKNLRSSLGLAFLRLKSKLSTVLKLNVKNQHTESNVSDPSIYSWAEEENNYSSYVHSGGCMCAEINQEVGYDVREYDQSASFQQPYFEELDVEDQQEVAKCVCRECKAMRARKIVRRSRGGRRKYRRITSRRRRVAGFKISRLAALASTSTSSASIRPSAPASLGSVE